MTAKHLKILNVKRSDYVSYYNRAKDFYEGMVDAEKNSLWNTLGLTAVHCAISLTDALTVYFLGSRSSGEDHQQAADLLKKIPAENAPQYSHKLKLIIAKKNAIAYDEREFYKKESQEIFKQTIRYYAWGMAQFPK